MGCGNPPTQPTAMSESQDTPKQVQATDKPNKDSATFSPQQQEYMYKTLVAELAAQRGQYDVAAHYFLDVAKQSQNADFAERATQIALYINEYKLALQTTQEWVKLAPTSIEANRLFSNLLLHFGKVDEALTHLDNVLNKFKDDPEQSLRILALIVEQPSDIANVLELMRKLLLRHANDLSVLLVYANLLIDDNKLERALNVVRQILDIDPNYEQGVSLYAVVLERQGKAEHALLWLKQALRKKPTNEKWRFLYAKLLTKVARYDEAMQQYRQLAQEHPENSEILQTLGLLALETGQLSVAKDYFTKLLNNEESADIGYYHLGQVAEKENNSTEALDWYSKVKAGKYYLSAKIDSAGVLFKQGRIAEGRQFLRGATGLNEIEKLTLIQAEARLLTEQKQYGDALAVYNDALKTYANNIDLLYSRALLAEEMGQFKQLEHDLRQILELEPNNVEALNALGYTLADRTQRYQEAHQLIKKALELSNEDPFHLLDSMGWVLYRMGQYQEAIVYLRQAQTKEDDPEVAAHLGEALWANGQQEEAKTVWEKALKTFPEDKKLREVMQKFLPRSP